MGLTITQVDAFTDKPFGGNPAAVCILPAPRDESWMQSVAREMNLSETPSAGTPPSPAPTCSGRTATCRRGSKRAFTRRAGSSPAIAPAGLAEALGASPKYVGKNHFDYLVELDGEATIRRLTPNHTALAALPVRGVIVTSRADSGTYDFVSRFFAPGSGIAEDPVTGSAHCALGPYWRARLGKSDLLAYQASSRRGVVRVRVLGDRVKLGGKAVTVLRGELNHALSERARSHRAGPGSAIDAQSR